jgi:hypothetical protein
VIATSAAADYMRARREIYVTALAAISAQRHGGSLSSNATGMVESYCFSVGRARLSRGSRSVSRNS